MARGGWSPWSVLFFDGGWTGNQGNAGIAPGVKPNVPNGSDGLGIANCSSNR